MANQFCWYKTRSTWFLQPYIELLGRKTKKNSAEMNFLNLQCLAWDQLGFMQGLRSEDQIKTEQEAFNPFQAPVFQPQSQPAVNQDSGINFSDCSVSSPGSSTAKSDHENLNTSQDFFTSSPPKIQQPGPSSKVEFPNSPTQFQVYFTLVTFQKTNF